MPRPPRRPSTPGQIGKPLPKPSENPLGTVPAPTNSPDLGSRLGEVAGVSLAKLAPTSAHLEAWNTAVTESAHSGFEHRVLLGVAINALRPQHGRVEAYANDVGKNLGRSVRWVRETVRVSSAVELAIDQKVALPLDIRDLAWSEVPGAIENVRNGRELGWKAPKEKVEPTVEEQEAAVEKALEKLVEALEGVRDAGRRGELVAESVGVLGGRVWGEGGEGPEVPEVPEEPEEPEVPERDEVEEVDGAEEVDEVEEAEEHDEAEPALEPGSRRPGAGGDGPARPRRPGRPGRPGRRGGGGGRR